MHKGDRVLIRCAGSGGYGDPLEREPERVLQDVVDGYMTAKAAHELYGVILTKPSMSSDGAASAVRRKAEGNPGCRVSAPRHPRSRIEATAIVDYRESRVRKRPNHPGRK